jgi:hypothetical protein
MKLTFKGPIAVPASKLDKVLRVQTHVNGEKRQDATTDDLIFSIPFLIMTLSEGQTLQPGDIVATGTVRQLLSVISCLTFLSLPESESERSHRYIFNQEMSSTYLLVD